MKNEIIVNEYQSFEQIKHTREDKSEYWLARELQKTLEYSEWRNFSKVLDRAMLSCKNSGFEIRDHFVEVNKTVEMPSKAKPKTIIDYELTRYACYLIVQNGDPRKEIIATGQTYFAIQTRRQELNEYFNSLDEDNKRLVVRGDIKQWNQLLAESAHKAGVLTDEEFATFQNAGYMGLYGGETVADIHKRKGLKPNEKILDFMASPELIANLFRISQTEEKIKNEFIQGAENATMAHYEVGTAVREAIKKVNGTLPEDMETPKQSISQIEKKKLKELKSNAKKLMLDE
ncbi:MAG: DNA damage-inducible protein D [Clostridia bacterium]|nr:DNA damage-inducible protein D [Clostridia bacterium]